MTTDNDRRRGALNGEHIRYLSVQDVRNNLGATSPGEGLILQGGERLVTRRLPAHRTVYGPVGTA